MTAQASFARSLLDPALACPDGLSTWNGSDPAPRFAVYRNNVVVSLLDALAETFPVTLALVGDDFFRAMARVYLQEHPPRTRVLTWLGDGLADFIDDFAPAAGLPYLPDVARLEMNRVRAYHAADAQALGLEALGAALSDPDALVAFRLTLHPSTQLLRSEYAVFALWAAHQGVLDISTVDPDVAQAALVYRQLLDVEVLQLTPGQGACLAQLLAGAALAQAADEAARQDPAFDLTRLLATLIRSQLITGIF